MRELDHNVIDAKGNPQALEDLIKNHEGFIIKSASRTAKRYISKSDDEWSVSLSAFAEAVEKYDLEKGSFMAFAELLIRRRLIDWFRVNGRFQTEIAMEEIEEEAIVVTDDAENIRLEIEALGDILKEYGFSFMDLVESSPKAQKTKESCRKTILWILDYPIIIGQLRETKQLPIKIIEKNTDVPRKILERHRKYIIAAVEIVDGDFPGLAEYVSFLRRR
jgi:RNA polymerase sigma factor